MTLTIHPAFYYRAKSEEWTDPWQERDYAARNIIAAVKGKPFKSTSRFTSQQNGKVFVLSDTEAGRNFAKNWCALRLSQSVTAAGYTSTLIVPVPSSSHTNPEADFTGRQLANAIQAVTPSFVASPSLYFREAVPKSSAGGGRDQVLLQSKLEWTGIPAGTRVVLLDDVFTTGAHLKAAARFLRAKGVRVDDAIVAARTRWERPPDMFTTEPETLTFF